MPTVLAKLFTLRSLSPLKRIVFPPSEFIRFRVSFTPSFITSPNETTPINSLLCET